jgi:hypothetical protein
MTYYAQRKSIKNGEPQAINNRFGEQPEMLRQYFLYCASAATNADGNEYDSIEYGTVEGGVLKTERFDNTQAEEPEE